LSVTSDLVTDTNDNANDKLAPANAKKVNLFKEDLTPPNLLSFDLDMSNLKLMLTFDETVKKDSVKPGQFTIQKEKTSDAVRVTLLATTEVTRSTLTSIEISLHVDDANKIKLLDTLAQAEANTHLSFPSTAVTDMNNQPVVSYESNLAKECSTLTPDDNSPILTKVAVDMHDMTFTLTFDETIRANTLLFTKVMLDNAATGVTYSYPLANIGTVLTTDSTVIQASFSKQMQMQSSMHEKLLLDHPTRM
jgi:hypothetical protein